MSMGILDDVFQARNLMTGGEFGRVRRLHVAPLCWSVMHIMYICYHHASVSQQQCYAAHRSTAATLRCLTHCQQTTACPAPPARIFFFAL